MDAHIRPRLNAIGVCSSPSAALSICCATVRAREVLKSKHARILLWQRLLGVPRAGAETLEPAVLVKPDAGLHIIRRVDLIRIIIIVRGALQLEGRQRSTLLRLCLLLIRHRHPLRPIVLILQLFIFLFLLLPLLLARTLSIHGSVSLLVLPIRLLAAAVVVQDPGCLVLRRALGQPPLALALLVGGLCLLQLLLRGPRLLPLQRIGDILAVQAVACCWVRHRHHAYGRIRIHRAPTDWAAPGPVCQLGNSLNLLQLEVSCTWDVDVLVGGEACAADVGRQNESAFCRRVLRALHQQCRPLLPPRRQHHTVIREGAQQLLPVVRAVKVVHPMAARKVGPQCALRSLLGGRASLHAAALCAAGEADAASDAQVAQQLQRLLPLSVNRLHAGCSWQRQ
mmetsp:Transcript_35282/g.88907  ORF Transcript_35282/g.88907 Transcript_35282/m.88907 type:complete len:396 (+) Transcript_35282:822-2009(+)